MVGVPLPVSNKNPILRRAGSKHFIVDLASGHPGISNEVDFLLPAEVIEMKSAAIAPSPIFLWRFKVLLFLLWGIGCVKIGWGSVMQMNADKRDLFLYEAFLYFNPLLLVTLMVWLWGINLWVFSQSSVNYAKVFDLDHTHLTHQDIWKVCQCDNALSKCSLYVNPALSWLFAYACETSWKLRSESSIPAFIYIIFVCNLDDHCCSVKYDSLSLSLLTRGSVIGCITTSVLLYALTLMALIFPFDIFYFSSRYYLLKTLWRIVLPLQAITFSDFFLADILTSMSKVISDLERSVCRMVHQQVATIAWFEADSICGSHSVAIPLVLVLPYLFRFFQCLRQYKDTKERTCLLNALKYTTAIPVIFLSALKYHVLPNSWTNFYRPLWLISSVINSSYSFYWDVTRDWDLSVFSRIFKFKSPHICTNLFYGRIWIFYWVIGSNLILRCTWTYKLSAHLRHNYITVFTITALEIVRRFQWIFFRVENEWNKISNKMDLELSIDSPPKEDDRLLGSSNHDV